MFGTENNTGIDTSADQLVSKWLASWTEANPVDGLYAPGARLWHCLTPADVVPAEDGLLARRTFASLASGLRVEVVRAIRGDSALVLEGVVSAEEGAQGRVAAPFCAWLQAEGSITSEYLYWDWSRRLPWSADVRGTLRSGTPTGRDGAWARGLAERLGRLWTNDVHTMIEEMYAPDSVIERLGDGPEAVVQGSRELHEVEENLMTLMPPPHRKLEIVDVSSRDDVVALRVRFVAAWRGIREPRASHGTIILTLQANDQVTSDRTYWYLHWAE